MKEIWKDVKGFEGRYQVSNLGRVKMMALTYYRHYPKGDVLVHKHPEIMVNPSIGKTFKVRLCTNKGERDHIYEVNRLVASHFMPEYKDGMIVTNIDGDISNNSVQNLALSCPKSIQGEKWKDIHGFEGVYQVSNMGRVRSLDRYVVNKNGKSYFIKGKMMKITPNSSKKGYLRIALYKGHKKAKHIEMQRLVALHFVPGYKPGLVVNHKDENPKNNRADNLEWCTQKYNLIYSDVVAWKRKPVYQYDLDGNFIQKHKCCADVEKMMGTYQGAMAHVMYESKVGMWHGYRWSFDYRAKEQWQTILKEHKSSLHPIVQMDDEGNEIARFYTAAEAAKAMGVSISAICNCANGKTQHSAGYMWKYLY